jgi:abequosyltransferase
MRLSICIPTHNFGAYIGETLQSILPQVEDGVEVVVLDGGSTDDTAAVVESLQRECPALRYERRSERGGIDRDMARVVDLAKGEYCWLFCADDIMKPGAIRRMMENLTTGCEVYLCGLTLCTLDMQLLGDHRVSKIKVASQFDLSVDRERHLYFEKALTTTAFFSFASSLTFRKSRWDAVGLDEKFVGSLWAHVARFFQMIPGGLRLHYLPDAYLYKRTENDSFADKGLVQRYAIAVDGYLRLADAHFRSDSKEAQNIRRVLRNEFPPWLMLRLKFTSEQERPEDLPEVNRLAEEVYWNRAPLNLVYRLLYRYTPRVAFQVAQLSYRPLRAITIWIRRRHPPPGPPATAR